MSRKEEVLDNGVVFITEKNDSGIWVYSLSNTIYKQVTITLDLSSSTGITFIDPETPESTKEIQPNTTSQISKIQVSDSYEVSIKYNYTISPVSDEYSKSLLASYNSSLSSQISSFKILLNNKDPLSIDPSSFPPGNNFIDPEFPPIDSSINFGALQKIDSLIHWRRAKDFMQTGFRVFDKITPFDIKQGQLGNCWFMCAISSLAEKEERVKRLFVDKEVNEFGCYRIKFCKNGEWVTVVVDDYFPCYPYAGPIFSQANGNEIWVLLLEKAYAKLHGSYALLKAGNSIRAFIDLTGSPSYSYIKLDAYLENEEKKNELWKKVVEFDNQNALISLTTPAESNTGLVGDHAYTLLSAKEVMDHKLVLIRNPWGSFEWTGDWSTNSQLWTDEMKEILNPVIDNNDGSFWMSYKDATNHFCEVNTCIISLSQEIRLKNRFEVVFDDGSDWLVPRNCYVLRGSYNEKVLIALHQEDQRIATVKDIRKYLPIGVVVLEYGEDSQFRAVYVDYCDVVRDVNADLNIEAGKKYLVIPRVAQFTCGKETGQELESFEWIQGENFHPYLNSSIKDLYFKWKKILSRQLEYDEFSEMMKTVGVNINKEEFNSILEQFPSYQDGLTPYGLTEYLKKKSLEVGIETLYEWFQVWGYDKDLFTVKSRNFTVSVHSNHPLEFNASDEPSWDLYIKANEILLRSFGEVKETVEGVICKSYSYPGTGIYLYGILNENSQSVHVTFDLSESTNLTFSRNKKIFDFDLAPNELKPLPYFKSSYGSSEFNLVSSLTVKFND